MSLPKAHEVEISLFGPGFGESVLIHPGGGNWIVVDSCRTAQYVLPLDYLESIGVDLARDVKVVLATHWHNDHVAGLSEIVSKCKSARFYCSQALGSPELFTLTEWWDEVDRDQSAAAEFHRTWRFLENRAIDFASADKCLFRQQSCEIIALSPSGDAIRRAYENIAAMSPAEGDIPVRPVPRSPNHNSVVLWVRSGAVQALLGSDMEEKGNPSKGWSAILDSPVRVRAKADAFKIPHHASYTGDHQPIWSELLDPNPIAICTPFRKGSINLPTKTDAERVVQNTRLAFITSIPSKGAHRPRTGLVNRTIHETVRNIHQVNARPGQIRLRRKADGTDVWRVELFGRASPLEPELWD